MTQDYEVEDQQVGFPAPPVQSTGGELELAMQQRADAIDQAADEYLREERPANTTRSYTTDWTVWRAYCETMGIPSRDVSPGRLVGFAVWLERGRPDLAGDPSTTPASPATIRRRVYGTVAALREQGVRIPRGDVTAKANEAVKVYERRLAKEGQHRGRGKAPAVTVKQLRAMCAELPDTLLGTRDRALLLLGFSIAARRDELAHLSVGDIRDDDNGLVVDVRVSKLSPRTVAVPTGTRQATCPVRAWHAWRDAAQLTEGRAFRNIDRHGNLGAFITGASISSAIARAADNAGIMVRFTGHSLRSGFATEARRAGHDQQRIARQGGWVENSASLHGYMRTVDQWDDNPLKGIGL